MTDDVVSYERRGRLGIITLERPEALNAVTAAVIAGVRRLALAAERDPEIVAICITGRGRGFCAGADMSLLTDSISNKPGSVAQPQTAPPRGLDAALFGFLLTLSKPVIAAVNGVAAGGGFILALMCDLRFVAEDAYFTTVFTRRGLISEHLSSWLLPRMIGLNRALDLLWSSRKVDAAEAYRLGLADYVVPADGLLGAVEAYVDNLAATVAPRALAVIKGLVHRHLDMDIGPAAEDCRDRMVEALRHPDAAEGVHSYLERRTPKFSAWTGHDA